MPYIAQKQRKELDAGCIPANAGELNYALHLLLEKYMSTKAESYQNYNDIIGVLECAKLELYRRKVAKYEEKKTQENGDIDFYQQIKDVVLRALENEPRLPFKRKGQNETNATHAVFMTTRKNDRAGIVFTGSNQDCVQFCVDKDYPEEFCCPEHGEYGDEEEHLEIAKL